MTFTTPHGTRALPAAVELVGLRLPRAVRAGCGRSAATRASRPRRSRRGARRGATIVVHTDRGDLRAPLVVDALGWRRVLTEPAPPAARRAAEPRRSRSTRAPDGDGDALDVWVERSLVRRGYGWRVPAGGEARIGVGSYDPRPARQARRPTRSPPALDARRPCATRATGSRTACAPPPRTASSSSATAPGTASRCRARGSAPPSTSASRPGRELRAVLAGEQTARARAGATTRRSSDAHAPALPARAAPAAPDPGAAAAGADARAARARRAAAGRPRLRLVPRTRRIRRPSPSASARLTAGPPERAQSASWRSPTTSAASSRSSSRTGRTGEVLTLAYANAEALARTRETGELHLWSRSRGELWHKGATLGQHAARPRAAPGLRRRRAARARRARRAGVPHRRAHVLPPRRARAARPARGAAGARAHARASARPQRPEGSYTVELLDDPPRIGAKVQEEAEEVARAAREETDERVDEEAADVLYHLTVLLHSRGRGLGDAEEVLNGRRR